jgi:hypothetical protein
MRPALAVSVAAVLAVSATTAHAQAPGMTPPSTYTPAPAAATPVPSTPFMGPPLPYDAKDPDSAILWSLGGTAAGLGLMYYGAAEDNGTAALIGSATFFFGPSFGQWYAGRMLTPGLGLRAGGVGLGYVGLAVLLEDTLDDSSSHDSGGVGAGLMLGGAALFVVGGIWDITTAGESARNWNERHTLSVMPTAISTSHGTASGLALTGTF